MSPVESLGTNRARNVILILFFIYAIAIGLLVVGYANVSSCLSAYANKSAVSTNARASAAAQDRELDRQEKALDQSDRDSNRDFSKALSKVLNSFALSKDEQRTAYKELLEVDRKTSATLDKNTQDRASIRQQRAEVEQQRQQNPVPPPPSESC